jgi:hypothetical protein
MEADACKLSSGAARLVADGAAAGDWGVWDDWAKADGIATKVNARQQLAATRFNEDTLRECIMISLWGKELRPGRT